MIGARIAIYASNSGPAFITRKLVARYSANEEAIGTITTWHNTVTNPSNGNSQSSYDAAVSGSLVVATDGVARYLNFGGSQYLEIPQEAANAAALLRAMMTTNKKWSVEIWFNATSDVTNTQAMLANGSVAAAGGTTAGLSFILGASLYSGPGNLIVDKVYSGGDDIEFISTSDNLSSNTKYCITYTCEFSGGSNTFKIYKNAVLIYQGDFNNTNNGDINQAMRIGADQTGAAVKIKNGFHFYELSFYEDILTAAEVLLNYNVKKAILGF